MSAPLSITVVLALCVLARPAHALQPDEIFKMNRNSLGIVLAASAQSGKDPGVNQGSGVVIAKETVLTNCHVLQGANTIRFKYRKGFLRALLTKAAYALDLCTLSVSGLEAPPVRIREFSSVRVGERVYAIGSPKGLELTISEGLVSGLREVEDTYLIQTTASISPGSSGGGLFDSSGNLIGITTFYVEGGQNLNFAMPASFIHKPKKVTSIGKPGDTGSVRITPEFLDKVIDLFDRQDLDALNNLGKRWVAADPDSPHAWLLIGMSQHYADNYKDAEIALKKALALDKNFSPAYYALFSVYDRLGKSDLKWSSIQKCAAVKNTPNILLQTFRALCATANGDRSGITELKRLTAENPSRSWIFSWLGFAYMYARAYDDAKAAADAALLRNPHSVWACVVAAAALTAKKDLASAKYYVDKALGISPKSPAVLEFAAIIALTQKDRGRFNSVLARLETISPVRAARIREKYLTATQRPQ